MRFVRFHILALWLAIVLLSSISLMNAYSERQDIDVLAGTIVKMLKVDETLVNAFHGHIIHHQEAEAWLEDPSERWPRELRARPL